MPAMTNTERKRISRRRRAAGLAVIRIEIDRFEVADALVEAGWLPAWDAEDPDALARAVEHLLGNLSRVTG